MPEPSAILSTLKSLNSIPNQGPEDMAFTVGFLAALGAKEVEDQASSLQRQRTKAQSSPAQMLQGRVGPIDQMMALARFGGGVGGGGALSPMQALMSRLSPATIPPGPAATAPGLGLPPTPGTPPGLGAPPGIGGPLGGGIPPGIPGGQGVSPLLMQLLQQRLAAAGGLV